MENFTCRSGIWVGILSTLFNLSFFLLRQIRRGRTKFWKRNSSKKNGGLLLHQHTINEGTVGKTKLFNAEELKKATDNFNESLIIGKGGQGTVYKGMLSDGKNVAIKKSKLVDKEHLHQFLNEVLILSQINHRNVLNYWDVVSRVRFLSSCMSSCQMVPLRFHSWS